MNGRAKGGNPGHDDPKPATTPPLDRVNRLKQQIATGRYRVDADAVAREMLRKLRLLSLTRQALAAGRGGGLAGSADR
jgi:hypothetical protein